VNYVCQICTANCDEVGNPGAVVDPLAKTLTLTCFECRLKALTERSRVRAVRSDAGRRTPQYNGKLATDRLPYKD
jgi:hypothetical protein